MARIERPQISRVSETLNNLPSYLQIVQGKLMIDRNFVAEGARLGPYDIVMDFGKSRNSLRGLIPKSQRLIGGTEDITILGFKDPTIGQTMIGISDLANNPTRSSNDSQDRQQYREKLRQVYKAMAGEIVNWTGGRDALIFAPKSGGIFVQEVFEQEGFPSSNFFDYRMSRVHKKDQGLMLGVALCKSNPDIPNYRRFVFADDCMASDISAFGTLEMIKGALIAKKIPLSEAEVLIAVSAASQRGIESLLSQKTRDYFGFGSMKVVAGIPVYKMNEHFYLQHTDDRYVVGDMGNWSQK